MNRSSLPSVEPHRAVSEEDRASARDLLGHESVPRYAAGMEAEASSASDDAASGAAGGIGAASGGVGVGSDWSAWPIRERPLAGALAIAGAIALAVLAAIVGGDPSWGALAGLVVLASLHGFLCPTRFGVGPEGVVARGTLFTRRIRWSEANLLVVDDRGGWIGWSSPRAWRRRGITLLADRRDSGWVDRLIDLARAFGGHLEIRDRRAGAVDRAGTRDRPSSSAPAASASRSVPDRAGASA